MTVVVEFENQSNTTFRGVDGVIYPGTRFYLVGKVTPTATPVEDHEKRVFTQDYTTTMQMTINSLANAYNILPNILSPRLELGIEIMPWREAHGTNVPLD